MKQRVVRNRVLELMQVKELKLRRRIKQKDIANFIGISEATIMHWIRNETSRFDANIIVGLCDYFDCDISDLLYFEEVEIEDDPDTPIPKSD